MCAYVEWHNRFRVVGQVYKILMEFCKGEGDRNHPEQENFYKVETACSKMPSNSLRRESIWMSIESRIDPKVKYSSAH